MQIKWPDHGCVPAVWCPATGVLEFDSPRPKDQRGVRHPKRPTEVRRWTVRLWRPAEVGGGKWRRLLDRRTRWSPQAKRRESSRTGGQVPKASRTWDSIKELVVLATSSGAAIVSGACANERVHAAPHRCFRGTCRADGLGGWPSVRSVISQAIGSQGLRDDGRTPLQQVTDTAEQLLQGLMRRSLWQQPAANWSECGQVRDCLRDSSGDHLAPEMRLRTSHSLLVDSRGSLCISGCRHSPMSSTRCANIHVATAWLSTSSKMAHTRYWLKFTRRRQGCRCAVPRHRDGRNWQFASPEQ